MLRGQRGGCRRVVVSGGVCVRGGSSVGAAAFDVGAAAFDVGAVACDVGAVAVAAGVRVGCTDRDEGH